MNPIVKRSQRRRKDEDNVKVVDSALDSRTAQAILEIMRKLRLRRVLGSIASGKEARIYPAIDEAEKYYALKVYYMATATSKRSTIKYIQGDPRFDGVSLGDTKELIYTWAKKEFKNLIRMAGAGVRVPQPFVLVRNVVAMEFLGDGPARAPLLRELDPSLIDAALYLKLIEQVELTVTKARLVHGDLSEYNVVIVRGEPYLIDVGQALPVEHDKAEEMLIRDLSNLNRFFERLGIETVEVEETAKDLLKRAGSLTS
ncbi:serine/threonine protein kinase [Sulfodiicoccus acidiphilus]|uniref:non-specific serine/threonine protein kinase n=1 Tax=Sulfodiicoccus acidiphilus TaxID=1670455 RepID=A0A348B3R1_9CREN|nr:serine protein kinase RIO [Sulfodiicoccus acidiphilus]BBD72813.1 serine/threonine protein kinase [Sulfodiicoccus acidiphilus]GGU04293.1 serine/threonine protein kinase [Sulfodiicoccus acidiphilus]